MSSVDLYAKKTLAACAVNIQAIEKLFDPVFDWHPLTVNSLIHKLGFCSSDW
jgi:hypothetical protein